MYFSIKPINNSAYYNRDTLSVIKNLQSLGEGATGNMVYDRQNLQIAEYEKIKNTLSPANEQRIQKASTSFGSLINSSPESFQLQPMKMSKDVPQTPINNQVGASQLAEINKIMHGLVA